ncbi:hypothetical protein LZZ85_00785 [Terrimonas sp. NA20]|uniref:FAD assembly factor SdhE n=1 Tax=Terrimonas ginsenosidimutans TaxID=2908004 RepID=A0ABS9KKE3_9BACT|nr:hypothetical protein [Terrimonas ginsenosidimutans]MCG2612786.1 hypothetical protein [Terrimonas ginsenosidimutans]
MPGDLPDKALLSKIILLRSQKQTQEYLLDDLRMDEELLRELDFNTMKSCLSDAPKRESLSMLLKTIQSL